MKENRKIREKSMKPKDGSMRKKIDKPLARLIRKKKKKRRYKFIISIRREVTYYRCCKDKTLTFLR